MEVFIILQEFKGNEAGFIDWCKNNRSGFVLNINGKTAYTKSHNKIHRPSCGTLHNKKNRGRMTTIEHPKYCTNDLVAITSKIDSYEAAWSYCGNCMKDYKNI